MSGTGPAAALPPIPDPGVQRGPVVGLVYGGFLLTGAATVLLGPLIPGLEASWGIGHSEAASLFVAQFATSSLAAVLSSFHLRRSLIGGYALTSLGLLLLAAGGWPLARVAMALLGAGLGLCIPATNLWVAHTFSARRGAALAALNLVWGLGAVSCPLLFALLLGRWPAANGLMSLAALTAAIAALLLALDSRRFTLPSPPRAESGRGRTGSLALLASMLFLYVGVENAIGGWLVALADEVGGERSAVSLLIGSGFWGALLAGRAATPLLLRRVTEPTLYAASLALAGSGAITLLRAGSRESIALGTVVAGLGLAALFPLTVSLLAAGTAATGSRTTGWVFALGGFGGAALPWLTGRAAAGAGLPGRGFLVPVAGLALLAALFAVHRLAGGGAAAHDGGKVDPKAL